MNDIPAFPATHGDMACMGMTLRDYVAAKVAQAVWSNNDLLMRAPKGNEAGWISAIAYEQADSMLKERAK